jgi:site-specific recombinase XerD
MTKIFIRNNADGNVILLARLYKRPNLNKNVALGVTVSPSEWKILESQLTIAEQAFKSGNIMTLRDPMAQKIWDVKQALDALISFGEVTPEAIKTTIDSILHADIIKEVKRKNEEVKRKKDIENKMTLEKWIEEFIRQCETGERLKRKSTRLVSPGTVKSYKETLAQLRYYMKQRHKIIDFDDVTLEFYDDLRRFFLEKKAANGTPRPYSPNTIGRHIKNLKIFLYAAKDMKLTTCMEFTSARFSADSKDVENVYLTDERVQQMYETDFEDEATIDRLMAQAPDDEERKVLRDQLTRRTPENLNEAKDIFVVGCLTGQRVSDYKRINTDMIRTLDDGNDYIYLQQEKTAKWIYIPLDIRVRAILSKYGGRLPKIYDQDLNERIKVIGRFLGWRENAGITELHGMMEVPTKKAFYECIKTHTARRTFATNAYKHKISLSSIMIITGHSSERMLRKYLKLDKEESAILAAAEFAKAREVKLKIAE